MSRRTPWRRQRKRLAPVVGNSAYKSAYKSAPLGNPANSAKDTAAWLPAEEGLNSQWGESVPHEFAQRATP